MRLFFGSVCALIWVWNLASLLHCGCLKTSSKFPDAFHKPPGQQLVVEVVEKGQAHRPGTAKKGRSCRKYGRDWRGKMQRW